ncbi:MAG: MBL fold metallo-hydrolase [Bryobacteraceae bacterium]|jgi:phosphoribosyl 1,2-cyclic phosphodiesterase
MARPTAYWYAEVSWEAGIVKFCVLASGSSGNCALLATDRTRILVDAGLSFKALTRRMESVGEPVETLNAVLVTHEHSDHISGLARLARRLGIPVYISKLTAPAVDWGEIRPRLECFQAGASFVVGDIAVDSFGIPHDAIDPVGFCFHADGVKVAVATDLGYITESVKFHLRRSNLMLLESNHDLEMLKVGPYPWSVKQRVMSRVGHLSNDTMSDFLLRDFDGFPARLVLGHLSEHNNHPEIVRLMATQALERRGLSTPLEIASQARPTEVYRF